MLLASCVIGSLANSIALVVHDGACALVRIVGDAVPHQATFFMSFLLQDAFLIVPLVDVLQLTPLCMLLLDAAQRALLRRLRRPTWGPLPVSLVRLVQQLYYEYMWARVLMVVGIGILFACLAPLTQLFLLLWLVVLLPVWSHSLRHCLCPPQGEGFDAGGAFWPVAVRLTTTILVTAQIVLVAILALNEIYAGVVLVLLLVPVTLRRTKALERYYGPRAESLRLHRCQELDAAAWSIALAAKQMVNDPHGGAPLPRQLLEKLDETLAAYEGLQRTGKPAKVGDDEDDEDDDYESEGALSESDDRQGGPPFSPDRRGALFSHAHDWLRRGQATVTRGLGAGRRTAVQRTEQSRLLPT